MNNTNDYLTKCSCGRTTSKAYAREHEGKCKACVTSAPRQPEDIEVRTGSKYAREEGGPYKIWRHA